MTGRRPRRPWIGIVVAALACEPSWGGFGAHACALVEGGAVLCWGSNAHGQLGDGGAFDRPTPAAVTGLPPAGRGERVHLRGDGRRGRVVLGPERPGAARRRAGRGSGRPRPDRGARRRHRRGRGRRGGVRPPLGR